MARRMVSSHLKDAYALKLHFTEKHISAQIIHTPTGTVATSASTEEKILRPSLGSTGDAAKIGKLLGERMVLRKISAVGFSLKREHSCAEGKVKAVVDAVREAGVVVKQC